MKPLRVEFFCPGLCRPGGSKRFVGMSARGKARVIDDNPEAAAWKERVALAAHRAMQEAGVEGLLAGPLEVWMTFYLPRLKGHLKKDGTLRPGAAPYPTTKPDALKLARTCEDALTHVIWRDDAQIVGETLWKVYADETLGRVPGVLIKVWELPIT